MRLHSAPKALYTFVSMDIFIYFDKYYHGYTYMHHWRQRPQVCLRQIPVYMVHNSDHYWNTYRVTILTMALKAATWKQLKHRKWDGNTEQRAQENRELKILALKRTHQGNYENQHKKNKDIIFTRNSNNKKQ